MSLLAALSISATVYFRQWLLIINGHDRAVDVFTQQLMQFLNCILVKLKTHWAAWACDNVRRDEAMFYQSSNLSREGVFSDIQRLGYIGSIVLSQRELSDNPQTQGVAKNKRGSMNALWLVGDSNHDRHLFIMSKMTHAVKNIDSEIKSLNDIIVLLEGGRHEL